MSFDNTFPPPSQSNKSPKILGSNVPPPPPSPQQEGFADISHGFLADHPRSPASSSRYGSGRASIQSWSTEIEDSPATALTSASTYLDPLQLPQSSISTVSRTNSLSASEFLGADNHWNFISLNPPALVSFNKGDRAFKLAYERLQICQSPASGELRHIELSGSDPDGFIHSSFVHTFPNSSFPVPHLEQPLTSKTQPPFVISFLELQTVHASGVAFSAQPHYVFSDWNDCVRFQETLFGKRILFMSGMARAKSKGRGEESISQNIRILQSSSGGFTLLFYPNALRKGAKRYIWLSGTGIDSVEQKKESVTLKLNSDSLEISSVLKTLSIDFLSPGDSETFCNIVDPERKDRGGKHKGKGKP